MLGYFDSESARCADNPSLFCDVCECQLLSILLPLVDHPTVVVGILPGVVGGSPKLEALRCTGRHTTCDPQSL